MPNYAIYDTDTIINVIIADSKEIAEEATGFNAIETDGEPWIHWTLFENKWRPPQPFNSWSWNGEEWVAPIPKPEDGKDYYWDEDLQNWIEESVLS